jgi:hypothetical protein
MTIIRQNNRKFEASAVLILSLLIIIPTTTAVIQSNNPEPLLQDWFIEVETTQAEPYAEGHIIPIKGKWAEDIKGVKAVINFDEDYLEIAGVEFEGTIGENAESTTFRINPGYFKLWIGFSDDDPYPAGEDLLAKIIVNVTVEEGETELNFTGWEDNCYYNTVTGDTIVPTVIKGPVIIGSLPELSIESISGGIGLSASIKNIGTGEATNVQWIFSFSGGFVFPKEIKGTFDLLQPDTEEIAMGLVFGLGKTVVTITVESAEGALAEESTSVLVLLFFVLGVE